MKLLLKNTKESYNREEKREEDNLLNIIKLLEIFIDNFSEREEIKDLII